eukprot:gene14056-21524_t
MAKVGQARHFVCDVRVRGGAEVVAHTAPLSLCGLIRPGARLRLARRDVRREAARTAAPGERVTEAVYPAPADCLVDGLDGGLESPPLEW